ncbi:hypothetical protein, partial [Fulvivirga imtechensis]|uniref:RHS repeat domain-containing protein n=1 Tax=Fulvivirga imtechensis TaxID=881893 RepID=UPI0005911359
YWDRHLNGNILSLKRQAHNADFRTIDALQYTYTNGNQLSAVADAAGWEGFADKNTTGPDYTYDANGNMTKDLDKEIESIEYNHLNLPAKVIKADGHSIQYLYDATGVKYAREVYDPNGNLIKKTEYIGELIYETDASGNRRLALL